MHTDSDNDPFGNSATQSLDDDETSGRALIFLLIGVVAVGCGLLIAGALFFFQPQATSLIDQYFPSPTGTATATPLPTATRTPTPTPNLTATLIVQQATGTAAANQAFASEAAQWPVLLTDTFDSNTNDWLVESNSEDDYSVTTYEIADGKYRWSATAHKPFIGWVRASEKQFDAFSLSVDAEQVSGPDSADYGLVFREDADSNLYYFSLDNQGEYAILLYFNGDWTSLQDWTTSDLIHSNATNRITVMAQGSHFIFLVNDQYLTDMTDDTIPTGQLSLAIELAQENDQAVFEFDNVELRTP